MRPLLDTHVALWLVGDASGRRERAQRAVHAVGGRPLLSTASVWEMAIKAALGRLQVPEDLLELAAVLDADDLPVLPRHAAAVRDLPPLHADPFDRLLVVQADLEGAVLVSADPQVLAYDVRTSEA